MVSNLRFNGLLAAMAWAMVAGACQTSASVDSLFQGNAENGSGGSGRDGKLPDGGGTNPDDPNQDFSLDGAVPTCTDVITLEPANSTLDVVVGGSIVPLSFTAKSPTSALSPQWSFDRGELGRIDPTSGAFTPSGSVGGTGTVTARFGKCSLTTNLTVRLNATQKGESSTGTTGSAGFNGVGGEGPGGAPSEADVTSLQGTPTSSPDLQWLYPYPNTVFPRELLAPLLQWRNTSGAGNIRALRLRMSSPGFNYDGYFARPPALDASADLLRHPIPQTAWKQALLSTDTGELKVQVAVLAGTQLLALPDLTLRVAKGALKGTVYYNSYGTNLVTNYSGAVTTSAAPFAYKRFGAATLAIHPGATEPTVTVGYNSSDSSGCRVCHLVSANGKRLVTDHGDERSIWEFVSLETTPATTAIFQGSDSRFAGWSALAPDASHLLSERSPLSGLDKAPSQLYSLTFDPSGPSATGTPQTPSGLPTDFSAGTPTFSPDGKHVAFTYYDGTLSEGGLVQAGDTRSLAVMDFDPATRAFSNLRVLYTPPAPQYAVWPAFLPTNDALVFQVTTRPDRDWAGTRSGCEDSPTSAGWPHSCHDNGTRAELWYVDLATRSPRPLLALNGKSGATSYLPTGPDCHGASGGSAPCDLSPGDDTTLNYEPTVGPILSGGYAWVIFTTRRLYGNVATINPWHSDPRFRNLSSNPTPKKLWAAAIDLNPAPNADPSHPAFYLPAQELLAGNARGFWAPDPCRPHGTSCETGDECCGGFCRPGDDGGGLVCQPKPPTCAYEFETCTTDDDCCGKASGLRCVNERCGSVSPR